MPIAFHWKDKELELEPGVYRFEFVVSGTPESSGRSSVRIVMDISFSVPSAFNQNESVTEELSLNGYNISYRTIGGIGCDEAWSMNETFVGGFITTSKFRDAIVIKLNGTDILWAKVWDSGEDDWVWDVSRCEDTYVAVATSKNGVLLKISDEGKLVWG